MQARDFNLRHLRAFGDVCRLGSISSAAETVHLSQPAITQAISKLEHQLDTRLFTRSSQGMFTTASGEKLAFRTQRAFDLLNRAQPSAVRGDSENKARNLSDLLTSTQIRALISVAAHGNFSVAARASGVSQPSLYRAAREVEANAGQTFFRKTQNGIQLTAPAETLAKAARLAFAELDQAIDEIAQLKSDDIGTLRIGSLPLARGTILPQALDLLTENRPRVGVTVTESPYSEMLHALRNGEIDMMLGALRSPSPAPDVQQEPLFDDHLGVFCGPDHPLMSEGKPDKATLAAHPWIVGQKNTPTRNHFETYFADFQGPQRGPIIETNAHNLIQSLLRSSNRLAMISATQVREEVEIGRLCRLNIDLMDVARPIGISLRSGWQPTPVQSEFLDLLRRVARKM